MDDHVEQRALLCLSSGNSAFGKLNGSCNQRSLDCVVPARTSEVCNEDEDKQAHTCRFHKSAKDGNKNNSSGGLAKDNKANQVGKNAECGNENPGAVENALEHGGENCCENAAPASGRNKASETENAAKEGNQGPRNLGNPFIGRENAGSNEDDHNDETDNARIEAVELAGAPESKGDEEHNASDLFFAAHGAQSIVALLVEVLGDFKLFCGLAVNCAEDEGCNHENYEPYGGCNEPANEVEATVGDETEHNSNESGAADEGITADVSGQVASSEQTKSRLATGLETELIGDSVGDGDKQVALCVNGGDQGIQNSAGAHESQNRTTVGGGEVGQNLKCNTDENTSLVESCCKCKNHDEQPNGAAAEVGHNSRNGCDFKTDYHTATKHNCSPVGKNLCYQQYDYSNENASKAHSFNAQCFSCGDKAADDDACQCEDHAYEFFLSHSKTLLFLFSFLFCYFVLMRVRSCHPNLQSPKFAYTKI